MKSLCLTAEDAQNTEDVAATDPLTNPPVSLLPDHNGMFLQEASWATDQCSNLIFAVHFSRRLSIIDYNVILILQSTSFLNTRKPAFLYYDSSF